jgi:hypothetical protein
MANPNANLSELSLSIAGIGVLVKTNHAGLVSALQKRYQDYLNGDEVRTKLTILYQGKYRENSLLDTGMTFIDRRCVFTAIGYEGYINIDEQYGQLNLSSKTPVEEVDYFLRVAYALLAFEVGGMMFHTAGIVRKGKAHLFFGHSGSGKTTVSRVSDTDTILNDDLLILLPQSGRDQAKFKWMAYSTPFWNPTQVQPTRESAPVVGIYRLVQDQDVFLEPMGSGQALAEMISNIPVIPDDPARGTELLNRGTTFLKEVPAYRLHFLPDNSFWDVIAPG